MTETKKLYNLSLSVLFRPAYVIIVIETMSRYVEIKILNHSSSVCLSVTLIMLEVVRTRNNYLVGKKSIFTFLE